MTSDKWGGTCTCFSRVRSSVCLSHCLLAILLKNACVDLDEIAYCMSTDVGTWTDWLTFQPDPDYSSDAGTGLFSPISYALQRGILLRRKNPTYRYWAPVAAATRGFNMFFCAPSTALLLLISIFDGFSVFIVVSTDVVSLLIVYTTFEKIRMFICIYC